LGAALSVLVFATGVSAAPARVEDFDAGTWSRLLSDLARPAVVVFSTTYCAICPEAFALLADTIEARRLKAPLVAVVMDGERHSGLLREAHYARADRLFVFRGQEAAVRYAVNKRWRGVTPFVVLLGKSGSSRQEPRSGFRHRSAAVICTGVMGAGEVTGFPPSRERHTTNPLVESSRTSHLEPRTCLHCANLGRCLMT